MTYDFEPPDELTDVDCFEFLKHTIAVQGVLGLCVQCKHRRGAIPTLEEVRCVQGVCERLSDLSDTLDKEIADIIKEVYYDKSHENTR